ncbi:DNA-binding transcriptional regulator, MocR family, contains an aminotransferase domain [Brevibacterium siliguriense]|uniref:DNA-binding transcriptional regulator, MocR family, contains an aminotransferase domain n=1 Tax=Brevibacterium siliguriense TaxID=1136497 RepID=A0A1H1USN4_9MICO|nr:PLP-dependent aminotransferase family protein [Brevibacterium siliguriense]SDS75300.1 DNA-binding transcriptional regulator, MocR family, contains an aminotransferase domain [Brevibacterium siliguriense]
MSSPILGAKRLVGIIGDGPWKAPAFESLAAAVAAAITDGRLPVGARLPSERELAAAIGLSRTTTGRAYAQLREQEFILTRRGSGSVVQLPSVPGGRIDHLLSPAGGDETEIDLTCTAPVAAPDILGAYDRALSHLGAYLPGTGYYPSGLPVLREIIADRYSQRGAPTDPDQILITSGALGGAAIAVRALLDVDPSEAEHPGGARPTSRVFIESPTYPNAIATLEGAGATLVTYPLEYGLQGHHWDIEAMEQLMGQMRPRSAYLIPDFHNPTGALLPETQRRDLAEVLLRHRVVPVFDESLVELGLEEGRMPTPMSALISDSVTVGSVSKVYWGGLRIGWMRIPRHRVDHFASSRLGLDLGAPVLEQLVTVELMDNHDAVVADCRSRLRAARDLLAAQVRSWLPEWKLIVPSGGMALWAELPEARSGVLSIAARNHGLRLVAGPNFAPAGGLDRWIRLPYTVTETEMEQVGPRLAAAWEEAKAMSGRGPTSRARIVA